MGKVIRKIKSKIIKENKQTIGDCRWECGHTKAEEFMNIVIHGIGIGLGIAAVTLLAVFAGIKGDPWAIVSTVIFGSSAIFMYFASTFCHWRTGKKGERCFEMMDNIAIYFLIAGTYTPFLLVNLRGPVGWTVFGILWAVAIFGTILKFYYKDKQPKWTVGLYLLMGWALLFILPQMIAKIPTIGLIFVLLGGISYTVGVIFYLWRRLKFSHAIWHLFVIGGTVLHFFAVLYGCILLN